MADETEVIAFKDCLAQIQDELAWGDVKHWSTKDFASLSDQIFEKTGTYLSVITLKRLFGIIKYESSPTSTTLDAMAGFLGYDNWLRFVNSHLSDKPSSRIKKSNHTSRWLVGSISLVLMVFIGFGIVKMTGQPPQENTREPYSFNIKKMLPTGLPNSVIFEYNASTSDQDAEIFIQQSWDDRLRQQVGRSERLHTSIYYHPGFFNAKLVVDDQIVLEEELFIPTKGWTGLIESDRGVAYMDILDTLTSFLSYEHQKDVTFSDQVPSTFFYLVQPFERVSSNDFNLEAELKNTFISGANPCQKTEIHALFAGGALMIPLSQRGCVGEMDMLDAEGNRINPELLGVDVSDWVNVRMEFKEALGRIFVNEQFAFSIKYPFGPKDFIGIRFKFSGAGSVRTVDLKNGRGDLIYSLQEREANPL